jgi:hypothetical protein
MPWWKNLLKYFLHGLAFSVIFSLLAFVWAFILVLLAMVGAFIGLIIGVIILFFIIGGLNSFLTDFIWSIPIKTKWTSLLGHGVVLFIALVLVHIPSFVVSLSLHGLATTIVLFLAFSFIDDFVAKYIAIQWENRKKTKKVKKPITNLIKQQTSVLFYAYFDSL